MTKRQLTVINYELEALALLLEGIKTELNDVMPSPVINDEISHAQTAIANVGDLIFREILNS